MAAAAIAVGAAALYEIPEQLQRGQVFDVARAEADQRHKLLLNVGCTGLPRPLAYSCAGADVCLEIDSSKHRFCHCAVRMLGSVLDLPFPDHFFGAAVCFHVLEHLGSIGDAEQAIRQLERVADRVYILVPARGSLLATLHPDHHLWLDLAPDGLSYDVEDRATGQRRRIRLRDRQYPSALLQEAA
jgi:Methyltransferase domain